MTSKTPQEKKEYIFNNIEKYVIDSRGNFFHADPDVLGEEEDYIGKDLFSYKELEKITGRWIKKVIIDKKEDWEIIFSPRTQLEEVIPYGVRNNITGYELPHVNLILGGWSYYLFGEFGYRGSLWKDYEKRKTKRWWWEDHEKWEGDNEAQPEQSEQTQEEAKKKKKIGRRKK